MYLTICKMPKLYDDYLLSTTRFNESTYLENKAWRDSHNWNGCIYGVPRLISKTTPLSIQLIVIEMLNQKPGGKILGFGFIKNYIRADSVAHIYSDKTYNRHVYNSEYRIDISEIEERDKEIIEYLESILFYGSRHMKRGQGITTLQWGRINRKYKKKVFNFFKRLFHS